MAQHSLPEHFAAFFGALNPSATFEQRAARDHKRVTSLIEDARGPAAALAPRCFLQGSYRQDTAIYTINDVDVVALCELWQPGSGGGAGTSWSRDDIFDCIAAAIRAGGLTPRYKTDSMVIKVDLDTKIEVLPVVYRAGNSDPTSEPFRLWRPNRGRWEDGFARDHQAWLAAKNRPAHTQSNFKPMVKVLKHLNKLWELDAVSFHLECLLFNLPDRAFFGPAADYIAAVLATIAATPVTYYDTTRMATPCNDRDIFTAEEWSKASWRVFHQEICKLAEIAQYAVETDDKALALRCWRAILGSNAFPATA